MIAHPASAPEDAVSAQLGQLLIDAGFTGIGRCAGPDGEPYQLGAGRLLLTARW
ncbi:MAG: hypothetical protein ACRDTA_18820 [Pseudonocardiaceae bacterium]